MRFSDGISIIPAPKVVKKMTFGRLIFRVIRNIREIRIEIIGSSGAA